MADGRARRNALQGVGGNPRKAPWRRGQLAEMVQGKEGLGRNKVVDSAGEEWGSQSPLAPAQMLWLSQAEVL